MSLVYNYRKLFSVIFLSVPYSFLASFPPPCDTTHYSIIDLGTLPDFTESLAFGVNESGTVVGIAFGNGHDPSAWVWEDGVMHSLKLPTPSEAVAVNDLGVIAGSATFVPNEFHACTVSKQVTDLGTLGGVWSTAYAINNFGDVVGSAHTREYENHACLWRDGECIDLFPASNFSFAYDVNDRGDIVGFFTDPDAIVDRAFFVSGDSAIRLPSLGGPCSHAHAQGINNFGTIVGGSRTFDGTYHACAWNADGVTDLGTLHGDTESCALDVNDSGTVIGYSSSLYGETHPVLWKYGKIKEIQKLITDCGELTLSIVEHVNNKGDIAGTAIDKNGLNHAVLLVHR